MPKLNLVVAYVPEKLFSVHPPVRVSRKFFPFFFFFLKTRYFGTGSLYLTHYTALSTGTVPNCNLQFFPEEFFISHFSVSVAVVWNRMYRSPSNIISLNITVSLLPSVNLVLRSSWFSSVFAEAKGFQMFAWQMTTGGPWDHQLVEEMILRERKESAVSCKTNIHRDKNPQPFHSLVCCFAGLLIR